jgi:hypothetical protein
MSGATILFRLLHIVFGVLWVGGLGLLVMFILPAVGALGPVGGQFMQHIIKNTKLTTFMPAIGGVTVVSGFWLYWHDMSVSGGTFGASRQGMTLGLGGLLGTVALIVGGIMTGGSAGKIAKISSAAAAAGGPPSAEQMAQIGVLQARMRLGARISFALLLLAVVAMAVARYL